MADNRHLTSSTENRCKDSNNMNIATVKIKSYWCFLFFYLFFFISTHQFLFYLFMSVLLFIKIVLLWLKKFLANFHSNWILFPRNEWRETKKKRHQRRKINHFHLLNENRIKRKKSLKNQFNKLSAYRKKIIEFILPVEMRLLYKMAFRLILNGTQCWIVEGKTTGV